MIATIRSIITLHLLSWALKAAPAEDRVFLLRPIDDFARYQISRFRLKLSQQ